MSNEYKDYTMDRYNELVDIISDLKDTLLIELTTIKEQKESGLYDCLTEKAIAQGELKIINEVLRRLDSDIADDITATIESEVMEIAI